MKNSIGLAGITLLLAASSLSAATHYVSLESTNPLCQVAVAFVAVGDVDTIRNTDCALVGSVLQTHSCQLLMPSWSGSA